MNKFLLLLLLAAFPAGILRAGDRKVIHVVSHDRTLAVTDPSRGWNSYTHTAVFPGHDMDIRKIVLYITYQCPDSLHCGEWDYVDGVFLRIPGREGSPDARIELARIISPYGWRFGPTWKFTWHTDLTDFAGLLRDSCRIEFYHSGYENNKDRGWVVTLDFEITEGKPVMDWLGMDTLWNGNFAYGDSTKPIEKELTARNFTPKPGAAMARLRILQTGHGMDDKENCAEFCSKWRQVWLDGKVFAQRQMWKECGDNPLYPQAGTWIFDRANWCPGAVVAPDAYDLPLGPAGGHTVALVMQPYLNPSKPTAVYNISSLLFQYAAPHARHDVALEEILAPSGGDEYLRLNPVCSEPRILVRNNGSVPVTSIVVTYGIRDSKLQKYTWQGMLEPLKQTGIVLPGSIDAPEGKHTFVVNLEKVNGKKDEYPADNSGTSVVKAPPVYGTGFILALRSNRDSAQNGYVIFDHAGNIVKERKEGTLAASRLYRDTLNLAPGCYRLLVTDTAGDGLDFWFNPEGGYGYVRLLDLQGKLIHAFGSDFGSLVSHWFTVWEGFKPPLPETELPIVNAFPVRNPGKFSLELFFNDPEDVRVQIVNADSTKTVFDQQYAQLKEDFLPVDISAEPDGFYYIRVIADDRTIRRKIKVKHQD
jgi:hypothetical protein